MKRNIFLIWSLIVSIALYATQESIMSSSNHIVSVNPNQGTMQYGVNLYTIKDNDFNWSIGVSYTSDGFRPLQYSETTGMNWNLIAGGVITREVMGVADDVDVSNSNRDVGYYTFQCDTLRRVCTPQNLYDYNISSSNSEWYAQFRTSNVDLASDIYTFSFGSYKGQFVIGSDGLAHIFSGDFVSVDLSGMVKQPQISRYASNSISLQPLSSLIKIQTLDGYEYWFGGTLDALEYSDVLLTSAVYVLRPNIMAWHLTKIIAPNDRVMDFYYRSSPADSVNLYKYVEQPEYDLSISSNSTIDVSQLTDEYGIPYYCSMRMAMLVKRVVLDSITLPDVGFKIDFTYVNKPHSIYQNTEHGYWARTLLSSFRDRPCPFLTNITVYSGQDTLSEWSFNYLDVTIETTNRLYLNSLTNSDGRNYTFDYNFAGLNELTGIDDFDNVDMYGYRYSNPFIGVLVSAINPLGCTANFSYMHARYDTIRVLESASSLMSKCYDDATKIYHNVSIQTISEKASNGSLLIKKRYEYGDIPILNTEDPQSLAPVASTIASLNRWGQSSGVLNVDFALRNDTVNYPSKKLYHLYPYKLLDGKRNNPLEYRKVKEHIYKHSASRLYTNIYYYDTVQDTITGSPSIQPDKLYPYLSQSQRRSRVLCEENFDQDGILCRKVVNTYYPLISNESSSLSSFIAVRFGGFGRAKVYYTPDCFIQKKTYTYRGEQEISEVVNYQRDNKCRIVCSTEEPGNGKIYFKRYIYPDNLFVQPAQSSMDSIGFGIWGVFMKHCLSKPIEVTSGFIDSGQEYITGSTLDIYKINGAYQVYFDSVVRSSDIRKIIRPPFLRPVYSTLQKSLVLAIQNPVTNFVPISWNGSKLVYDARYSEVASYTFNSLWRMTSIMPYGQLKTTYQWDSNNMYIEKEQVGNQSISYVYKPFIGITSQTDVRGVTTYYRYDACGRLVEVYQLNGDKREILNAYSYNYAH